MEYYSANEKNGMHHWNTESPVFCHHSLFLLGAWVQGLVRCMTYGLSGWGKAIPPPWDDSATALHI